MISRRYLILVVVMLLGTVMALWGAAKFYRQLLDAGQAAAKGAPPAGAVAASAPDDLPRGWVVFTRGGGIWRQRIGSREAQRLAPGGGYPRISHDGKRIAFVQDRKIAYMNAGGGEIQLAASAKDSRALAWHPDSKQIFFTDGREVRRVNLQTGAMDTVVRGHRFLELDVAADGRRLVATVKTTFSYGVIVIDPSSGQSRELASGCSASFSPDGRLVTVNADDHRRLLLFDSETGKVRMEMDAPPKLAFDNQFWSNHPDWIVSLSEGDGGNVFIHQVSRNRSFQVTSGGGCDRPDLFVEIPANQPPGR